MASLGHRRLDSASPISVQENPPASQRVAASGAASSELFRAHLVDMIYVEVSIMGYTVILEQEPDGGYVVHAPALPGCVSQGDMREEALVNIREAMELYIDDCLEAGDPMPEEVGREFIEIEAST